MFHFIVAIIQSITKGKNKKNKTVLCPTFGYYSTAINSNTIGRACLNFLYHLLNPIDPGLSASCLINACHISWPAWPECENGATSTIQPSFKYCFTCFESSSAS